MMKMLIFVGNPTQYHSPIFRKMAQDKICDIEVLFGSDVGVVPTYNPQLRTILKWDVPVLEGYKSRFFWNLASRSSKGFFSRVNPHLFFYVIISKSDYVLIHGYDTVSSWLVYFGALLSRKKIIWRGEAIKATKKKSILQGVKGCVLKLYFTKVTYILYSCLDNKEYLLDFDADESKYIDFPSAVDNEFFTEHAITDGSQIEKLKKSCGFSDEIIVGTTCRLTQRKRVDFLVRALSKHPKAALLVVGDGPEREDLLDLAEKLGVKIFITGFIGQKEVAHFYSIMDIFSLVSSYDASPKALSESLNFGLPLILAEGVGSAKDALGGVGYRRSRNGFLIKETEFESNLEYALNRLINDENLRSVMKRESFRVNKSISIERGLMNLYNKLQNKDEVNKGIF